MQIPPGQAGPTAAFIQALQGTPRTDSDDAARGAAKPVTRGDDSRAVQAASRSDKNAPPAQDGGRKIPRGSFVDIRT